jgi:hypothetical protein
VYQHRLAAIEDEEVLAKFDPRRNELIRLTDEEHAAFARAVRPVVEKHRAVLGRELLACLERGSTS